MNLSLSPTSPDLSASFNYTNLQGFGDLRRMAREESPEAAEATARQFEALFIQMMLKSMREATPVDEAMASEQVTFFQGMLDQQMALEMSQGEGIGLRDAIMRELLPSGQEPHAGPLNMPTTRAPTRPSPSERALVDVAGMLNAGNTQNWHPETPDEFIQTLWPQAQQAARELNVPAEVLIAQAALETGWGRHIIPKGQGESSFNLFGIKADSRWQGERAHVQTLEYVDGVPERQRAAFRAYPSLEDSFNDYVNFLQQNPRYRDALAQAPDAEGYVRGLQAAGYATDPRYADKILSILHGPTLQQQVELKLSADRPLS